MRIAWLLFCFYGLSFSTAHAATLIDLGSSSCSGNQSFDAGSGLSFSCSGDFSLKSGSLWSDTSISVSSLGNLSLDAFTLSAPSILLNAASIHIGSNATLIGHIINLSANDMVIDGQLILSDSDGSLVLNSGGDVGLGSGSTGIKLIPTAGGGISLGSGGTTSLVPISTSFTMLLTGLLALVTVSRRSLFRTAQ